MRKVTPMASAASSGVAPARTAAWACDAMHPSQPSTNTDRQRDELFDLAAERPAGEGGAAEGGEPL
jgi:hypothetical protein